MRNLFIALLPALIAACGASEGTAAEAPKPAAAKPAQAEQKAAPPKVELTETAGTWTKTSDGISPMVVYASAEGEQLFSAACIAGNEDTGGPLLEVKSVSSGDEAGGNIDIFTSAGNARLSAAPDRAPGTASGMTETDGQAAYVLAGGAGEIKIVSGTKGVTFQTNQMLEDLIEACRPAFKAESKEDVTQEGEEAKDAAEEETPSGT